MSENPLVTCICPTRNRREWLPKAIESFKEQTYQPKELLIIADGIDVSDLVPSDENIRLIIYQELHYNIGRKRNFACTQARGEIICHFDDDDWSAPERISDQVKRLAESGKAVTGYHTIIFAGAKEGRWKYIYGTNWGAIGTSLCYRKDWWEAHQFPAKQIGEDGDFVMEAARRQQIVTCDGGELIIASIHPGNTSPRQLHGSKWVKL